MDDQLNLFEDQHSNSGPSPADILNSILGVAVSMIRDTIPQASLYNYQEIKEALTLCARSGGLYIKPPELWAYFRYLPGLIRPVMEQNLTELAKYDLSIGPFRYYAAFISPGGYKRIRELMRNDNGTYVVTGH